jgi:hypothetical protein
VQRNRQGGQSTQGAVAPEEEEEKRRKKKKIPGPCKVHLV